MYHKNKKLIDNEIDSNALKDENKTEHEVYFNKSSSKKLETPDLFTNASEIENKNMRLSTSIDSLDEMLGGGLETRTITQIQGLPGSGKTSLCLTICSMISQEHKCLFIDTENAFRSEIIERITKSRKMHSELKNIFVASVSSVSDLENVINKIRNKIELDSSIKLVIIDSMTNYFRAEYMGPSNLPKRQQKITEIMHKLKNIAKLTDVAMVITNQIYSDFKLCSYDKERSVGGYCIDYPCSTIIKLSKYGKFEISASLEKSLYHEYTVTRLLNCDKGIIENKIENNSTEERKKRFEKMVKKEI